MRNLVTAAALGLLALSASGASANPVLLIEPATGAVLHADEPDRVWHPASLTKLMTAYLVFEAVKTGSLRWDDEVPLSAYARGQPATRIGLKGGIKVNVEQAVRGLILRSANDFAVALAERVSGSEEKFVEAMNGAAKRLGMTRTVYRNPHGLPDADQVSTARDQAILTMALARDFPDRADVFETPTVRIHKGTFHSGNDLLRTLDGADGMKTGFTCASGYNVVASATRNGTRLVAVVLGAVNRAKRSEQAADLLEAGFAHLEATRPRSATAASKAASAPQREPGQPTGSAAASAPPAQAGTAGGSEEDEPLPTRSPRSKADLAKIAITSVALKDLALAPAEPLAAHDMARQVRSGKCRGYGGFAKPVPAPEATPVAATEPAEGTAANTGATAGAAAPKAARTNAIVKDVPAEPPGPGPGSASAMAAVTTGSVAPPAKAAATSKSARPPKRAAKRLEPSSEAEGDGK